MGKTQPSIAVLVATYNGADNLLEQLESYRSQTLVPALVLVSDDGSTDATWQILEQFSKQHPDLNVQLLKGPRRGVSQNFLHLLRHVPDHIDMASLSDQDDIWLPEKLARGAMMMAGQTGMALYCGRTLEWQAEQDVRRVSRLARQAPGFRHALVQNIAGGNTMILNRKALNLVQAASRESGEIVIHDWWIYQIVTAAGGRVIYDETPMMLYRQHPQNLIGANRGAAAKVRRLKYMLAGRYRQWGTLNIRALKASEHRITTENADLLEAFATGRDGSVFARLGMLWKNGFYRQGAVGQTSLYLAALLKRL
ncbi:MAG: glycosyltransferase [Rhodobacterales bacterium]